MWDGLPLGHARGAGGSKLYDLIDHEYLDEATLLTVQEQIAVLSAPVDEKTDEQRGRALERLKGAGAEGVRGHAAHPSGHRDRRAEATAEGRVITTPADG
jgi:hypothetical protein